MEPLGSDLAAIADRIPQLLTLAALAIGLLQSRLGLRISLPPLLANFARFVVCLQAPFSILFIPGLVRIRIKGPRMLLRAPAQFRNSLPLPYLRRTRQLVVFDQIVPHKSHRSEQNCRGHAAGLV